MQLFGELLLALNHRDCRRSNSGETQPVAHSGLFRWIHDDIANTDIQMELNEGPPVHDRLDRIPRSTIGSTVEVHRWFPDSIPEEFAGIRGARVLELFEEPAALDGVRGSRCEIEIPGGSGGLEPQFHGVAALQDPVCAIARKQSGKETIESYLSAETLQIDPFFECNSLEPLLKSGTKRAAGCILSFGSHLFPCR